MVFFESRDCSKKHPPLSSFRIRPEGKGKIASASMPSWQRDLQSAVLEAKKKMGCDKSKRFLGKRSKQRSGEGVSGRDRVERGLLESCLR